MTTITTPINSDPRTNEDEREEESDLLDVVIVGAGWAGLSAARKFQEADRSLLVLEARNEIGGRCRTIPLCDGKSVAELGAQWIHDSSGKNVISRITKASGIATEPCNRQSGSLYLQEQKEDDGQSQGQSQYRPVTHQEYRTKHKQWMQTFLQYQEKRKNKQPVDISLEECVQDFIEVQSKKGWGPFRKTRPMSTEDKAWFNYFLDSEIVQEYGASLPDLSLWYWDSDDIDDEDENIDLHLAQKVGGGYQAIINHFAQPLVEDKDTGKSLIRLNCKVTGIDWSSEMDCVSVHYEDTTNASNSGGAGENKRILQSRKVLITVPLGVLKAKTIQFQPPLPENKQMIIDKMGYGCLNKCVLLWDDKDLNQLPWPMNKEWIERIVFLEGDDDDDNNKQGIWTEFYNSYPLNQRPMLIGFLAGQNAVKMEQTHATDEEIQQSAMSALREWFAPQKAIPDPIQVVVTRWQSDEFSFGSYSYNALGAKHRYRNRLADPIDGKLYFAGEACHHKYPSTTQGACLSGQTAGERIIQELLANKDNDEDMKKE